MPSINTWAWSFESIEDLLFYCCPECDTRTRKPRDLMNHALKKHKQSIPSEKQEQFISDLNVTVTNPIIPSIKKKESVTSETNQALKRKAVVQLETLSDSKILRLTSLKKDVKDEKLDNDFQF